MVSVKRQRPVSTTSFSWSNISPSPSPSNNNKSKTATTTTTGGGYGCFGGYGCCAWLSLKNVIVAAIVYQSCHVLFSYNQYDLVHPHSSPAAATDLSSSPDGNLLAFWHLSQWQEKQKQQPQKQQPLSLTDLWREKLNEQEKKKREEQQEEEEEGKDDEEEEEVVDNQHDEHIIENPSSPDREEEEEQEEEEQDHEEEQEEKEGENHHRQQEEEETKEEENPDNHILPKLLRSSTGDSLDENNNHPPPDAPHDEEEEEETDNNNNDNKEEQEEETEEEDNINNDDKDNNNENVVVVTTGSYVVNLLGELQAAQARLYELPVDTSHSIQDMEKIVAGDATKVQPCEYLYPKENNHDNGKPNNNIQPKLVLYHKKCWESGNPTRQLILYNSASFPRKVVCGGFRNGKSSNNKHSILHLKAQEAIQLNASSHDECLFHTTTTTTTTTQEQQSQSHGGMAKLFPITSLFPVDPIPLTTTTAAAAAAVSLQEEMPPPIVIYHSQKTIQPKEDDLETIPCTVPCQHEKMPQQDDTHHRWFRYVWGADWTLVRANFFHLTVERTAYRDDKYYATTNLESDIPYSFYNPNVHSLRNRPPIDYHKAKNRATYLINDNCMGPIRRNKWFAAVQVVYPIDAYGECEHNVDLKRPHETLATLQGRLALARKNRIHLAMEITDVKDHLTTHTFEALLSGAVPAIVGPVNLEQLLPPHSAILSSQFNSWDKFAATIVQVANDEVLWNSYHAWRTNETALAAFEERYAFTRTSQECRMCQWAYAKQYGLSWNHAAQRIQPFHIPRDLCLGKVMADLQQDEKQVTLITKPFVEEWMGVNTIHSLTAAGIKDEDCSSRFSQSVMERSGHYSVRRSVIQHDGVVDMVLDQVEQTVPNNDSSSSPTAIWLRLHIPIRNSGGAYFRDPHTLTSAIRTATVSSAAIQDRRSKVTVLTSWRTKVWSPSEGIVEIQIANAKTTTSGSEPDPEDWIRRIRVITEDVDQLHHKITEFFPSSYATHMTKDFVDPIEMFYVES